MNYGGLTREVLLVELPKTFVSNYHIQLARASLDTVSAWVDVAGGDTGEKVAIRIPELKLRKTAVTDKNGRAVFSFKGDFKLWSAAGKPGFP